MSYILTKQYGDFILNFIICINAMAISHISGIAHKIILIFVLLGLFVLNLKNNTLINFKPSVELISIGVFVFWSCFSAIWTKYPIEIDLYIVLIYSFILSLFFYCYMDTLSKVWIFLKCVVMAACIFCLYLFIFYGFTGIATGRMEYAFVSVNRIGTYMAIAVYMSYFIYVIEKKRKYLLALLITGFTALWSGSRTAFLMIIVSTVIFTIIKNKKSNSRPMVNLTKFMLGVVVFALLISQISFFYDVLGARFEAILLFLTGENANDYEGGDVSTAMRLAFIQFGWEGFLENPIGGYGLDQFRYYNISFSHCNMIELLFNLGIIGFSTFYFPYLSILYKAISRKLKIGNIRLAILVGFVLSAMIEGAFSIYYNDVFDWLCLFACVRLLTIRDGIEKKGLHLYNI